MADIYLRDDSRTCSTCGKEFYVLYPELWAYKTQKISGKRKWYCSWKCLQASRKKEEEEMAGRGRPRRNPEEKKDVAAVTAEPEKMEIKAEEPQALEVVALRSRIVLGAEWHRTPKGEMMISGNASYSMNRQEWTWFAEEILQAMKQLGI